jgi:hypothetical protein
MALMALCAALLCGLSAFGAEQTTSSNRFLFIIDTSASMKPFENVVREAMFDLIYSGMRGRMTNGDTYGLWLIGEENDMSFKMETWRQRHTVEMAARAAAHVKDHGFKGKLKLSQALADATAVIKNVEDLTVILLSNGESPIGGTPFDDAINGRFVELAPQIKKAKATLNTALIARDGQFVAWAVNSPDFLIEVPYVAPTPKRAKPQAVAQKIPETAPAPAAKVAAPSATPRVAGPPIIITKDTVAQERRTFLAMTSTATNEPAAVPAATNMIAAATPVVATNVNEVKTATATTNAVAQQLGTAPTNAPVTKVVAATKSAATNVASVVKPATPAAAIPATMGALADTTPATQGVHPLLWVGLGAGAAFTCVLAILVILRSRRQEPSLISQSLVRERVS